MNKQAKVCVCPNPSLACTIHLHLHLHANSVHACKNTFNTYTLASFTYTPTHALGEEKLISVSGGKAKLDKGSVYSVECKLHDYSTT